MYNCTVVIASFPVKIPLCIEPFGQVIRANETAEVSTNNLQHDQLKKNEKEDWKITYSNTARFNISNYSIEHSRV